MTNKYKWDSNPGLSNFIKRQILSTAFSLAPNECPGKKRRKTGVKASAWNRERWVGEGDCLSLLSVPLVSYWDEVRHGSYRGERLTDTRCAIVTFSSTEPTF
jgi:hypothetical protein